MAMSSDKAALGDQAVTRTPVPAVSVVAAEAAIPDFRAFPVMALAVPAVAVVPVSAVTAAVVARAAAGRPARVGRRPVSRWAAPAVPAAPVIPAAVVPAVVAATLFTSAATTSAERVATEVAATAELAEPVVPAGTRLSPALPMPTAGRAVRAGQARPVSVAKAARAVAFSAALARVARSVVPVVSAAVERLVALGASADTRRATLATTAPSSLV